MKRNSFLGLAVLTLPALAVALAPTPARACGGTFCDNGPNVMPVDQTGENILFITSKGHVEAHIQIQYDGDPERFAWIIPVPKVPNVDVGSQQLFTNMLIATVPAMQVNRVDQGCGTFGPIGCGFSGGSAKDSAQSADDGFEPDPEEEETPDVVKRGFAGGFEYVVLEGGTVDGVVNWLDMAGYAQDPDAPPILAEYLAEDFLFLAVKLRSGAGVDEIQPLVIDYEGTEPCVPIRLTRIAAVEDMGIRAFFLGEERVVPQNFKHVTLNPIQLHWTPTPGDNYEEVVTLAVDEAGGHAFVTEFADRHAVATDTLVGEAWDSDAYADLDPTDVVDELIDQGLMLCDEELGCQVLHPQVTPLLDEFVPVPEGMDQNEFYSCLSCFEEEIDYTAWDGPGFANAIEERVVAPGLHAIELLDQHSFLTRLFTTMSPHEMTVDPMFHRNGDLPAVSNLQTVDRNFACEGPHSLDFDDGRFLALDDANNQSQPDFLDMPYAMTVEMIPAEGAPMVEVDNGEEIDSILDDWNAAHPLIEGPPPEEETIGGCGCRDTRANRAGAAYFAGLGLLAASFRRRRKRR